MHSRDDFIDAAARLFADGGLAAIRMDAVARGVGAPSGSVYHRYPDRPALLAALWLRTARDFQVGYLDVLGPAPDTASAVDAAVWIVHYCRERPTEAAVLQAGVRTFAVESWSEAARAEVLAMESALRRRMSSAITGLSDTTGLPPREVEFALIDLPLAVARKYLQARKVPPKRAADMVRGLAGRILNS